MFVENKKNSFKTFIDIRNVQNIDDKFSFKILFQQIFLILTFSSFISLIIVSYSNGNQNILPNDLGKNLSLRLCRALFPVFLTWYIFFSVWSIKTGLDYNESSQKIRGILLYLSFIPINSLVNIFLIAKYINKNNFIYYKELLFTQDNELKEKYKWGSWRRNILLGLFIVLLPVVVFIFFQDSIETNPNSNHYNNIWFYSFNYFTIQTNLMILFFTGISLFFPGLKIFKNNNLQIVVTVYIFIVGAAWNGLLLPSLINTGKFEQIPTYKRVITFWYHLVDPIVFITCSLVLIFKQPFKKQTEFKNIFKLGLIYPLMYLTFVAIVPFTAGVSIYSEFTNVNPNLLILLGDKNVPGSYVNFVIIIGFWFLFLFFIWMIWFIDLKVNKIKINKNKE